MTITVIGIGIVLFLLAILSMINMLMTLFNRILFNALKILLPISLVTIGLYHGFSYIDPIIVGKISYIFMGMNIESMIDIISGMLTIVYTIYMLKRKNKGIVDILYQYTVWGTVDNFVTKVQLNMAEKFTQASEINYTSILPSIWLFATDSLNQLSTKFLTDIAIRGYPYI